MTGRPLVLVVDDNPITLRLVRATLQCDGWDVETALTAAAAEATFDAHRPDAVIVDLALPDVDGFTLARRLRDRDAGVPILAYSALVEARCGPGEAQGLFEEMLPKPSPA